MKTRPYILTIIIITLICCNASNRQSKTLPQEGGVRLHIDLESAISKSDALEQVGAITLESKGDTFPGFVHKMMIENDTIYLLDTFKSRGLYVYDRNGQFLYTYDKAGQGSDEFVRLSDFQVYNDMVYLLDSPGKKIITINKQGQYQSSMKLSCSPLSFALEGKDGGTWMDVGNTALQKEVYALRHEHEGNVREFVPVPEELHNVTIAPYFTLINVGDSIHFLPEMQNRIFRCKGETVDLAYYLDFEGHWCPLDFFKDNAQADFRYLFKLMDDKKYVTELNFLESKKWLVLSFKCASKSYTLFYDKANTRQTLISDDNTDDSSRPIAIRGDEIFFVDMTESANVVYIYHIKQ